MYSILPIKSIYRTLLLLSCGYPAVLSGQTILQPGDVAVVALAANTGDGSPGCTDAAGTDVLSLVVFRDIETGTTIDITDNGWERSRAGYWGNREGFVRLVRTGGPVKAGQLIQLRFPPSGSGYAAVAPDSAWTFEDLGATSVNFNSNGDQLFVLQGGVWDGGISGMDDASYAGGRMLFAFNSRTDWLPFQNSATDSGLPPMMEGCYQVQSGGETSDFLAFVGDTSATGRLEWLSRVHELSNWRSFETCSAFEQVIGPFRILADTIGLTCRACGACSAFQDSITVRLPKEGGPFLVDYTDGRDTFQLRDILDGYTFRVNVADTLVLQLLAIRNASGCAVFSDLGSPLTLAVSPPPVLFAYPDQSSCGPFVLPDIVGDHLSGGQSYYLDAARQMPALKPGDRLDSSRVVYVYDKVYACETTHSFTVTIQEFPEVGIGVTSRPSCADPVGGALELYLRGNGPFSIFWNKEGLDDLQVLDNLEAGTYKAEVVDANGCQATAEIQLAPASGPVLSCERRAAFSPEEGPFTGSFALFFSEGTAPYTVAWTGRVSGTVMRDRGDSLLVEALPPGQYRVVLTDAEGCTGTCGIEISAANTQTCRLELALEAQDGTCASDGLGMLRLRVLDGQSPFVVDWNVDVLDGLWEAGNLLPGMYTAMVTDALGCTEVISAEIGSAEPLNLNYTVQQPACSAEATGTLSIHAIESGTLPLVMVPSGGGDSIFISTLPYTLRGLVPGDYAFVLTDAAGCALEVDFTLQPATIYDLDLGPDVMIRRGDSIVLGQDITLQGAVQWTPANFLSAPQALPTVAFPYSSLTYTLTITTPEGCSYRDELRVRVNEFNEEIYAPGAFSPDNDGHNDKFTIFGSASVRAIRRLYIFNRWGELLFDRSAMQPGSLASGWDGRFNGVEQPVGVYLYRAEIELEGGSTEWISGDFLLVR